VSKTHRTNEIENLKSKKFFEVHMDPYLNIFLYPLIYVEMVI